MHVANAAIDPAEDVLDGDRARGMVDLQIAHIELDFLTDGTCAGRALADQVEEKAVQARTMFSAREFLQDVYAIAFHLASYPKNPDHSPDSEAHPGIGLRHSRMRPAVLSGLFATC